MHVSSPPRGHYLVARARHGHYSRFIEQYVIALHDIATQNHRLTACVPTLQLAKAEAEAAQAAKEKRMLRSPRAERIRQMIFEGERASATSQTAAQEASPATASEPQAAQAPPAATSSQGSKSRSARQFYTIRVPESDPELVATLRASNVRFGAVSPSLGAAVSKVLLTLVALWVPLLPMFLIFQRQFGGRDNRRCVSVDRPILSVSFHTLSRAQSHSSPRSAPMPHAISFSTTPPIPHALSPSTIPQMQEGPGQERPPPEAPRDLRRRGRRPLRQGGAP